MKEILKATALFAFCTGGGVIGGYWGGGMTPVQGQIAIIDVQAIVKSSMDKNPKQSEEDTKALTEKIKDMTESLVAEGMVVLDSTAVLSAPEEAYVTLDQDQE
ncbi:hypothetical protein [Methylomonas sp. AM2-LC]|uniref:hypothetical protein n=1 Tax=Methylomonas sp. AM2-LC TaxID=3153301 RepID=UPI003264B949